MLNLFLVLSLFLLTVDISAQKVTSQSLDREDTGSFNVVQSACADSLCGTHKRHKKKAASDESWKKRVFTAEELKKYDGKDGRPAYVAIDGIVYDVTGVKAWKGGQHKGYSAGKDHSSDFHKKAPGHIHHDKDILSKLPKVGVLIEEKSETPKTDATTKATPTTFTVEPSAYGRMVSCPVMGKKFKVSKNTPALKYKNKEYYLCCPACVEPFKKNPEKYIK